MTQDDSQNLHDSCSGSLLPDTSSLLEALSPFHGQRAYEIRAVVDGGRTIGNHGDHLMYDVFLRILTQASITITDDPASADFLFARPNGALLEIYQFPDSLKTQLVELPDLPLVIFPSSAKFPTRNPSEIFGNRSSETLWFFREEYSYEHILTQWGESLSERNVSLVLDHDVVASGHRYVPEIVRGPLSARHVLIAARIDVEATDRFGTKVTETGRRGSIGLLKRLFRGFISRGTPGPFRRRVARTAYSRRLDRAASRMISGLPVDLANEVGRSGIAQVCVDLSSQMFVSYDEYQRYIRNSSIVVTDRLHVALPAAVLGKRVILVEAGYHKLTGVYQRSLSRLPNISLAHSFDER